VEWSSQQIATLAQRAAGAYAVRRCLRIEDAGRADVYCLTVPDTGAFAVESGIIAHNCTRYLIMSGLALAGWQPQSQRQIAMPHTGDSAAGY
jgi:hypothetical protein